MTRYDLSLNPVANTLQVARSIHSPLKSAYLISAISSTPRPDRSLRPQHGLVQMRTGWHGNPLHPHILPIGHLTTPKTPPLPWARGFQHRHVLEECHTRKHFAMARIIQG